MPLPPLTRAHPRPLWPIQNRGAPGKLIFGFIVPRTSQMADLVNTCRTRVPHLPRLLPLPTLKSWVAVMILKSAPHPKIPKKLVVVVVVVVAVEAKGMQRGQGLIVQSPHDTCPPPAPLPGPGSYSRPCPPPQSWRPETATASLCPLRAPWPACPQTREMPPS